MDIPYPQRNLNDKKRIFFHRLSHFRRMNEKVFWVFWVVDFESYTRNCCWWNTCSCYTTYPSSIKSHEPCTPPDFADESERGQVIYKGSWRQDNAQNVMLPLPTHKQNDRYSKNA